MPGSAHDSPLSFRLEIFAWRQGSGHGINAASRTTNAAPRSGLDVRGSRSAPPPAHPKRDQAEPDEKPGGGFGDDGGHRKALEVLLRDGRAAVRLADSGQDVVEIHVDHGDTGDEGLVRVDQRLRLGRAVEEEAIGGSNPSPTLGSCGRELRVARDGQLQGYREAAEPGVAAPPYQVKSPRGFATPGASSFRSPAPPIQGSRLRECRCTKTAT